MLSVAEFEANVKAVLPPALIYGFMILGLAGFTRSLLTTLRMLMQTFIMPGKSLKKYGAGSGAWAVITGATDGIGKEFALQLAKAGFNVFLISRSLHKLEAVATEISSQYKRETKVMAVDFNAVTEHQYKELAEACHGLTIGVLINNVGRSHEMPVSFAETPLEEQQAIINININGTLRMTKIVLPGMIEKKKGLILTLSSFAGSIASPLLATYSGSKVFLQTWSDALQSELGGSGVDIQCLNTYFVVSGMSKIRKATPLIPTPKDYVKATLKKIGLQCGALGSGRPSMLTPYWSHALLDYLIHFVNNKNLFIGYTLNLHKDIRKRALRKKAREAAALKKE